MSLYRERLTEEDEKNIDIFLNPYPIAVEETLKSIENANNFETKLNFVTELSVILCHSDAVRNPTVQLKLPRVVNLLKDKSLYNTVCIVLADSCRHLDYIQNLYYDLKIFDLLDFNEHYKQTTALVFSLCYKNKKNGEYFFNNLFNEERDKDNEMIKILKEDHYMTENEK